MGKFSCLLFVFKGSYIDITGDEGRKVEAVTSQNGLHQEIHEPTHILDISSSCIDLLLTLNQIF